MFSLRNVENVQDIQYSGMPYIWDANLLLLILKEGVLLYSTTISIINNNMISSQQ